MKLNSADVDKSISDFEVSHSSILRDDKYLTPVVQDDGLLVYCKYEVSLSVSFPFIYIIVVFVNNL